MPALPEQTPNHAPAEDDLSSLSQNQRDPLMARRLISQGWRSLRCWFQNYAFSPLWLPERWQHPIAGYVAGVLLVAAAIGLDLLIFMFAPNFDVPGLLVILAILLTALSWGAGPSLAATLAGAALMNYFDFTPRLVFIRHAITLLVDNVLFILVGLIISIVAMQIQSARRRAEAAAASFAAEHARSDLERQRLQAVLEVLPVGVAIADAQGQLLEANKAFRDIWGEGAPLPATIEEYDRYKGWWSANGTPIAAQEWALARALTAGEVSSGEEVEIETLDGRHKVALKSAAPIRNEAGTIVGAVAALVDITASKAAEQQLAYLLEHEQTLRAEAEKAAERWRALQIISETALTQQPLDEMLQALLEQIAVALSIENCVILLLDETGQAMRIRAVYGLEADLASQVRIPLGKGAAGRVAATPETLIINDLSTIETVYQYFRERFRSFVGAPLVIDGQVIGIIHMTSVQKDHFTEDDARLLELLASRIALVIDRARLYEAERRAHAEAEARASQLEAIFEALADGLVAYDAEGRVSRINMAARRILGSARADLDFEKLSLEAMHSLLALRSERGRFISLDEMPGRRALRGEVLTGDRAQELVTRKADGQDMLFSVSSTPVRDAEGHIVGAVSIVRDVTEHRLLERRTQEALSGLLLIAQALMQSPDEPSLEEQQPSATARRLAELTARILECQRLGIFSFNPETYTLYPVALVGPLPEGEPLWQFESLFLRADDALHAEFLTRLQEGKPMAWDITRPPLGTRPDPFRIRTVLVVPMRLREHLVGALFLDYGATDHTYTLDELSLAEGSAMLAALVLERERLLREREEARASALALRAAYRQMDEFLGLASHELRTPLTSILLGLQLSQRRYQRLLREDHEITERFARKLKSLSDQLVLTQRQANRLDRLVHDLLDVSRIQRGELLIQRQMADLATIVTEVVKEQRQAAPGRRIHLHLPPGQRVLLSIDPERISQVITNYLTNALKYSAEEWPVEVGLKLEADAARVWVRDHGPGLPPEEQALIWERFHRAPGIEVRSGSGVGLGLGLHISRTIIEAHQGQVGVQSAPGDGSTFWFTLPLAGASPSNC
jgi:PAS domain S-box-containing protein